MLDQQEKIGRYVPLIDAAIAYLTSHDEEDVINTLSGYPDVEKKADALNRTLLHVAASQGKNKVIEWLHDRGANLFVRDHENHWTALHRAAFYGYLSSVNLLIELGRKELSTVNHRVRGLTIDGLLAIRDKESLTYLDLLVLNGSQRPLEYKVKGQRVAFTWGLNANNILGHEKTQATQTPEQVDLFRRLGIGISAVSLGTYHAVFLGRSGEVFTCGHGVGGRLGHGDERSLLIPRQVLALKEKGVCKWVSASFNQSFFIMRSDIIYVCGVNAHNLMCQSSGVEKLLIPRPMDAKPLRGLAIEKVFGLKHHVVVQTPDSLYTFGLNAGQLGHPKLEGERRIAQPRCVTKVNRVKKVAVSDAATVVVTEEGHVFVLQDYSCKKILISDAICDICISGGKLDDTVTSDWTGLDQVRSRELVVTFSSTNHRGKVFTWTNAAKTPKQLLFNPRHLKAKAITLSRSSNLLAVISAEGQLWQGHVPYDVKPSPGEAALKTGRSTITLDRAMVCPEFVEVQMTRVPNIHRAEETAVDDKGTSFALIAMEPHISSPSDDGRVLAKNKKNKANSETTTPSRKVWFTHHPSSSSDSSPQQNLNITDYLPLAIENSPDMVIKSKEGDLFTCHKDILMSKTPYFETMFKEYKWGADLTMGWCENTEGMTWTSMDMRALSLNILLTYIYSGSLDSCERKDLEDCTTLCECLLAADQYFIDGLRLDLESRLCKMINIKTVVSLARLSLALQAEELGSLSLDFLCDNAPCLVESGAFNGVDPHTMARIDSAYRDFVIKKSSRTIIPYDALPFPSRSRTDSIQSAKKKRRAKVPPTRDSIKEDEHRPSDSPTLLLPAGEVAAVGAVTVEALVSSDSSGPSTEVGKSYSDTQKPEKGQVKKVSQKARKEEERKKRQLKKEIQKPEKPVVSHVKVNNPWKTMDMNVTASSPATLATPPSPATPSFKALMELEMKFQQSPSEGPKVRSPFVVKSASKSKGTENNNNNNSSNNERFQASFGLVVTGFRSHQQKNDHLVDHQRTPNKEPLAPTSPWGKIPTNPVNPGLGHRAEADSDVFSSILKDEEKQLQTRHRVTSKSLHLVQLEERAIEELKAYYGADEGREHVVITRAPSTASKPLWAATQRQHKSHS